MREQQQYVSIQDQVKKVSLTTYVINNIAPYRGTQELDNQEGRQEPSGDYLWRHRLRQDYSGA